MQSGLTAPGCWDNGHLAVPLLQPLEDVCVGCESPSQAHMAQAEGCGVTGELGEKLWGAQGCS